MVRANTPATVHRGPGQGYHVPGPSFDIAELVQTVTVGLEMELDAGVRMGRCWVDGVVGLPEGRSIMVVGFEGEAAEGSNLLVMGCS